MKKSILLTLAVATVATIASAQEYKPAAGSKTIELQLAPLGGSPISIGGLRFRSFSSETSAMRADVFLGYSSKTTITQQAVATTGFVRPELKEKKSSMEISLMPGMEMHMAGTDRFSPYMAYVLDLGWKSSSDKQEHQNWPVNGSTDTSTVKSTTTKGKDGFIRLGLGLAFGADYYLAKKIYIGAECGLGLGFKKMSKIKTKETNDLPTGATATPDQTQGGELNFGPTVNAKFRLGWNF